jgi:AAA domain-containing protein/Homeodomain-like domain-containing protein
MNSKAPPSIFDNHHEIENDYSNYPEFTGTNTRDCPDGSTGKPGQGFFEGPGGNPVIPEKDSGQPGNALSHGTGQNPGISGQSSGQVLPLTRKNPEMESVIRVTEGVALMDMELPPRSMLMSPWLPERGLAMVYAPRGIGKTFFALEVAMCVATGTPFLGWEAENAQKVLYLDGEMSRNDLQARMRMLERGRKSKLKDQIWFVTPEDQAGACPDLSVPAWHSHLEPHVSKANLIIVDNISTLCRTGSENDAESWGVAQDWAIQQKSAGRSVLFIHHAGKGGAQRGTSKREDVMDTVIALKRPNDYQAKQGARFEVHFEKSRGFSGDEAEPFVVQLAEQNDQLVWESDSLEETSFQKAIEMLKLGMNQKDIAEELQVNKSTVSRYVNRAKQEGLLAF